MARKVFWCIVDKNKLGKEIVSCYRDKKSADNLLKKVRKSFVIEKRSHD